MFNFKEEFEIIPKKDKSEKEREFEIIQAKVEQMKDRLGMPIDEGIVEVYPTEPENEKLRNRVKKRQGR